MNSQAAQKRQKPRQALGFVFKKTPENLLGAFSAEQIIVIVCGGAHN
jgi:hypothetical protein